MITISSSSIGLLSRETNSWMQCGHFVNVDSKQKKTSHLEDDDYLEFLPIYLKYACTLLL